MQKPRAVRMQVHGDDLRTRIAPRDRHRLSAWSRAAIENSQTFADESCDELRRFILDHNFAASERLCLCYIAGANTPCRGKKRTRVDDNAFRLKRALGDLIVKPHRCHRDCLVIFADAASGIEPVFLSPTFDQPNRMREGLREFFTTEIFPRRLFGELR